tara:strand:+ start:671 stop:817 length:147 start_codon:yes stop_codon:yes gene_type:complete
MKYILKDYAGCDNGDEPVTWVFKNKDEVITKLLNWCNAEALLTYEVRK